MAVRENASTIRKQYYFYPWSEYEIEFSSDTVCTIMNEEDKFFTAESKEAALNIEKIVKSMIDGEIETWSIHIDESIIPEIIYSLMED